MIPFRQALFDTTFDIYITKRVATVMWVINIIIAFLAAVVGFVYLLYFSGDAFANDLPLWGLGLLFAAFVGVPIFTFLALVFTRLGIEVSVALISVAENTLSLKSNRPQIEEQPARESQAKVSSKTESEGAIDSKVTDVPRKKPFEHSSQLKFSLEDTNAMISDFQIAPNDFASDVLGPSEFKLWVKYGKPDLEPWIRLGLPDFELWLKYHPK